MATMVELMKIVWGGSLLAIISFGTVCAFSPKTRARLTGSEPRLRQPDRQDS